MRPGVDWQPSLFDGGTPAHDAAFSGLQRLQLDEHSWVDYCPGWLAGSDAVFAALAEQARWQQRTVHMYDRQVLEPRLTAGWSTDLPSRDQGIRGDRGTPSGEEFVDHGSERNDEDADTPPVLRDMAAVLSSRYGVRFDRIWVNLYRDGADSVAWHGDRNRLVMTRPLVATVSLGARRRFLLRRRGTTTLTHRLEPGHGDLVVMGGRCQSEWEHTVPKTARQVGPGCP